MTQALLTVQNLTKDFGNARAVDGVSFQVLPGQVVAVLGGNGAGKTTTLAMLLGLILPTSGRILALGHDMATDRFAALARMNFSSPYVDLPHRLTVRQSLVVFAKLYGVADIRARIAHLSRDLHLEELLDRPLGQLSAGQKTRAALAKSLVNEPVLLLLDEPTASLDPDTADWVRSLLQSYQKRTGAAILLASHNMAEVERMADHVLMMKGGRIVDEGAPKALSQKYGRANLEETFLAIARGGTA